MSSLLLECRIVRRVTPVVGPLLVTLLTAGAVLAHAYPKTSDPQPNGRLDVAPQHLSMTYDSPIDPRGSSLVLMDSAGNIVPTTPDRVDGNTQAAVSPSTDLGPGPYTLAWTSLSSEDGHSAHGFYTFVVNGGPVGILNGVAQSQTAAADLMATLTVTTASDGGSLLRVDLNDTTGVERVRIRLSRPDLGEDLLDTQPSGDGGWVLDGNEVALPGNWQAVVIARRTNIFDDAQSSFGFSVDASTGTPAFAAAQSGSAN